jgi:flagellar P-ring protein precursor FlgI
VNVRPIEAPTALAFAAIFALAPRPAAAARLKELVEVEGFRKNVLVGVGIVTGLSGTGDDVGTFMAKRPLATLLRNLGSAIEPGEIRARNVALVTVTAELPPFARPGAAIDVTVSSVGTARSLEGGTLIATAMKALDQRTYAIAQGQLIVGGYDVGGRTGSFERKNYVTVGRIPAGATVEREVANALPTGELVLTLKQPDFTTATRIRTSIDADLGADAARVRDPGAVVVKIGGDWSNRVVELVARLEALEATPDAPARVVIDERTGTIVVGNDVKLSPVAIAYGGLKIRVTERFAVSQPIAPFGRGNTTITPDTQVDVTEQPARMSALPATSTVAELANALNGLGVKPRDLVAIFHALKAAGALAAEIKVL